jgi:hypothetical protein
VTLSLISQPTFCPIVHCGFDNSSLSDAAGKNHICFAVIVCQDGRILIFISYYFVVASAWMNALQSVDFTCFQPKSNRYDGIILRI